MLLYSIINSCFYAIIFVYLYKIILVMSLCKEQIEHLERTLGGKSKSRKWLKNQRSRYLRRKYKNKNYDVTPKEGFKGWEY